MNENLNGLNISTVVGSKSSTVHGGKHVIDHTYPEHKVTDGAFIVNCPAQDGMIYEGDLGQFDYGTNTVKHMKVFVLETAIASGDTEIKVLAGDGYHIPEVGEILAIAPADFDVDTVTAKTVTAVVLHSSGAYYTVTLEGALGTAADEGTVLVEAASAGNGKAVLVKPNVVFPQDIFIYQTPATTYNASTGFKYYTGLYDACALLGRKLTVAVPAGARVLLRKGYSDIKIVE